MASGVSVRVVGVYDSLSELFPEIKVEEENEEEKEEERKDKIDDIFGKLEYTPVASDSPICNAKLKNKGTSGNTQHTCASSATREGMGRLSARSTAKTASNHSSTRATTSQYTQVWGDSVTAETPKALKNRDSAKNTNISVRINFPSTPKYKPT